MGLAVLPARLKEEMAELEKAVLAGADLRSSEATRDHADWAERFLPKYGITPGAAVSSETLHEIIEKEIGLVFLEVLKDAGVYKCTKEGREAFLRFAETV